MKAEDFQKITASIIKEWEKKYSSEEMLLLSHCLFRNVCLLRDLSIETLKEFEEFLLRGKNEKKDDWSS